MKLRCHNPSYGGGTVEDISYSGRNIFAVVVWDRQTPTGHKISHVQLDLLTNTKIVGYVEDQVVLEAQAPALLEKISAKR